MNISRSSIFSKSSVLALIMAGSLYAPSAIAQNNDDEIIVTARRQNETLIEVPVSVSAFDDQKIEDLGMRSIDDIARHTAGFSFSQAFGRTTERPVIRGAANILAGVQYGVESGAAYFIDGVYYSGDMAALDLRNLAQVEVIKGAQSALYGRNTYSGAINFITKRPSSEGFEGNVEALAAEDGEIEVYGRLSNSFADNKLGVSVSGRYYKYDGDSEWINAVDGSQMGSEETFSLNGIVDLAPNDAFSMITRVGYSKDDDGPRPFRLIGAEQNNCFPGYRSGAYYDPNYLSFLNPPFAGIIPNTVTTDSNFQYFCGNLNQFEDLQPAQNLDGVPFIGVERDMLFATHKMEYNFAEGYKVLGQFGLRKQDLKTGSDSDHQVGNLFWLAISPFFSIPQSDAFLNTAGISETFDYSGEIRIQSPDEGRFRWSIGAFYYDSTDEDYTISFGNVTASNPEGIGLLDDTETVKNKAVFGTLSFDVTDALEVALEARYQEETKGVTGFADAKFDDFIPKAIISYDINDQSSAYASYARGVKPGGSNGAAGLAAGRPSYEPEKSNAFEIGYKRDLGGRGNLGISGYFNDISLYQLTTPVATISGGNVNSIATNQGDAEIMGVEVEGTYDLTDSITVGGSYAWTDAEFTSGCDDFQFTLNTGGFLMGPIDVNNPPTEGVFRDNLGTTPTSDPDGLFTGNLSCSIAGNTIPMTSEHQVSLFGSYEAPISNEMDFFLNVDLTHESSKFVQVHNQMETGGTTILGGNMGIKRGPARFEIFARNILDERTPPIATRWFDLMEGFPTTPSSTAGYIDRTIVGPRSTFLSFRRGRQIGVRASMDF